MRVETLYGLKHGKNVSAETARKIADALNSTVNYIFEPAQTAADLSSNTVNHYHKFLSTVLPLQAEQLAAPHAAVEQEVDCSAILDLYMR